MTASWLLRPAAAFTGTWRSICLTCEHSFRAEQIPAYLKRRLFQPVAVSTDCCVSRISWLLRPAAISTGSLQMAVARVSQSIVLLLLTFFSKQPYQPIANAAPTVGSVHCHTSQNLGCCILTIHRFCGLLQPGFIYVDSEYSFLS